MTPKIEDSDWVARVIEAAQKVVNTSSYTERGRTIIVKTKPMQALIRLLPRPPKPSKYASKEEEKQAQRDRMNERNKDPVRKAANKARTQAWQKANPDRHSKVVKKLRDGSLEMWRERGRRYGAEYRARQKEQQEPQ